MAQEFYFDRYLVNALESGFGCFFGENSTKRPDIVLSVADLIHDKIVDDNDDIVTNQVGQMLYNADIDWCRRFKLSHIKQLGHRIINKNTYQKLWIDRCDRSYNLLTKTSYSERMQLQNLAPDLFLYGASEDISILYYENEAGELFIYKDKVLLSEK